MGVTASFTQQLEVNPGPAIRVKLEPGDTSTSFRARVGSESELRELEVELLQGGLTPLALVDGYVVSLRVSEGGSERQVSWKGSTYTVRSCEPTARGRAARAASAVESVLAPMPGRVVQVHVRAGDPIEAGAALLVVEAMKMQNAIFSPRSGRIARVLVVEGQPIERGTPLLDFERTPTPPPNL